MTFTFRVVTVCLIAVKVDHHSACYRPVSNRRRTGKNVRRRRHNCWSFVRRTDTLPRYYCKSSRRIRTSSCRLRLCIDKRGITLSQGVADPEPPFAVPQTYWSVVVAAVPPTSSPTWSKVEKGLATLDVLPPTGATAAGSST